MLRAREIFIRCIWNQNIQLTCYVKRHKHIIHRLTATNGKTKERRNQKRTMTLVVYMRTSISKSTICLRDTGNASVQVSSDNISTPIKHLNDQNKYPADEKVSIFMIGEENVDYVVSLNYNLILFFCYHSCEE